jgi:hypothetical protein
VRRAAGAASWLHLHAQIQARRAGCICMRRYRRGELVAFARCAALYRMRGNALRCTGCAARADALRAGCSCMRRYRHHAFDGGIFRVGFFGIGSTLIHAHTLPGQTEGLRVGCGGKNKVFIKPLALGWVEGWAGGV